MHHIILSQGWCKNHWARAYLLCSSHLVSLNGPNLSPTDGSSRGLPGWMGAQGRCKVWVPRYCSLEVKCNYPLSGMEALSDTEVEVSQPDVDQAHQPQGCLCRLQPLCATEYSCPLQYPRVVSVYPALLIAQHLRHRVQDRMDAFLMLKRLQWNVYI